MLRFGRARTRRVDVVRSSKASLSAMGGWPDDALIATALSPHHDASDPNTRTRYDRHARFPNSSRRLSHHALDNGDEAAFGRGRGSPQRGSLRLLGQQHHLRGHRQRARLLELLPRSRRLGPAPRVRFRRCGRVACRRRRRRGAVLWLSADVERYRRAAVAGRTGGLRRSEPAPREPAGVLQRICPRGRQGRLRAREGGHTRVYGRCS
jgi:hypothetical protein